MRAKSGFEVLHQFPRMPGDPEGLRVHSAGDAIHIVPDHLLVIVADHGVYRWSQVVVIDDVQIQPRTPEKAHIDIGIRDMVPDLIEEGVNLNERYLRESPEYAVPDREDPSVMNVATIGNAIGHYLLETGHLHELTRDGNVAGLRDGGQFLADEERIGDIFQGVGADAEVELAVFGDVVLDDFPVVVTGDI